MDVKLAGRINAGKKIIAKQGEWWRVKAIEEGFYRLESCEYCLRVGNYVRRASRTIPMDGGELFLVESTRPSIEDNPNEVGRWPVLEKILQETSNVQI